GAVLHLRLRAQPPGRDRGGALGVDRVAALPHHPAVDAAADALAGWHRTGLARDPRAPVAVAGLERGRLRAVLHWAELRRVQRAVLAGCRHLPADRGRRDAVRAAALRRRT